MGRLVKGATLVARDAMPADIGQAVAQAGNIQRAPDNQLAQGGDTYLERVAKYVPAEIIAFFVFADNILKQAVTTAADAVKDGASGAATHAKMAGLDVGTVGVALLVIAWGLSPIYLYRMREAGDAWKMNALLAFLLFPVWAYATDAVALHSVFDGNLASIVLGLASLLSGLFRPGTTVLTPGEPAVDEPVLPHDRG